MLKMTFFWNLFVYYSIAKKEVAFYFKYDTCQSRGERGKERFFF